MSTTMFMAEPPEGVARDTHGQTSIQRQIIVIYSITLSIAALTLAARLYSRLRITRFIGLDDCMHISHLLLAF